ncbi:DNA-directed RNA polymerase II subunit RPB11 [Hibiscus syriacus]|uniref:DNA-directed RNA polymerase II subunit RPB11 n=1 Tax=Hibiscus syriacus TaxID=106335 RepID=A0A6A3AFP5_HIBSY|nr:DNA-directed RNA polymerase II subunit RPB11 [Hibiscus syriacus]
MQVGVFLASMQAIRDSFGNQSALNMDNIVDFGMILYTFVLGLEMDPYVIFKSPSRPAILAYASVLSTCILTSVLVPWLHYGSKDTGIITLTISFSITLSGTGSHILTRLITNLKIGKSDIGKLTVVAGVQSDMITMFILSLSFFFPLVTILSAKEEMKLVVQMATALVLQTIVAAKISPAFFNWVNKENPEGKALKGSHLVLSMAFIAVICSCAPWFKYSPFLSSFMPGLFLPSEGRISKWAISKINYLLSLLFYPLLFFCVGLKIDFTEFEGGQQGTWEKFFALLFIVYVGKIAGTIVGGVMLGFRWPEMEAIGLLWMAKGHFHVYFAVNALRTGKIEMTTCISMVFVFFLSIVHTPFVVKHIIERARQLVPVQRMTLQCLDPTSELRILLCVHGPHNVPSCINPMEVTRGQPNPGLRVYVTDMVELTEKLAETLEQEEGTDNMVTTDKSVIEMREQITRAFRSYVDENTIGITLGRSHVLSTISGMVRDLTMMADDLMVTLILLPFHKSLNADRTHDSGSPAFRYVNRKNAPRRLNNRANIQEEEAEMKLDDESFTEFYEKYIAGGKVSYMEKHLANSSETYTILKALKGQYTLIIVGQGGRVNTILTFGLKDWRQCPELGSVGDVLSGPGFECEASVLIIQQHRLKGQLDGLNDDFSIM